MASNGPASGEEAQIALVDRIVGTIIVASVVVNIVAARSTVFVLPALALIAIVVAVVERQSLKDYLKLPPTSVPVAVFLSFAVISSLWSADSMATFSFAALIVGIYLQWHVANRWFWCQPLYRVRHFAYWMVMGALVGSIALLIEVYGEQYLRRLAIDNFGILTPPTLEKHWEIDNFGRAHIRQFELNRSVAAANMILWPAVLSALAWWSGRKLAIIVGVLVGSVMLATFGAYHETSKIAALVGLAWLAVGLYRPRLALLAAAATWIGLLIAVPYASHVAYDDLELHKAKWLQFSARERIIIWGDIASRVPESPLIGVGARTGYVLNAKLKASLEQPTNHRARIIARHAHNIYLQTWFELGAVGASLLLVAGLVILQAISRLEARIQPFAVATFTVFMIEIASTWELWQRWYAALFAVVAVYLVIAMRSYRGRDAEAPAAPATPPLAPADPPLVS